MPVRRGYSLIEVIVVVSISGLLVALLLPAVQMVRGSAAKTACLNRMRQIGLALQNYESARGHLPPGLHQTPKQTKLPGSTEPDFLFSWRVLVLPHLEQDALWQQAESAARTGRWSYENPPHTGLQAVVKVYTCPADGRLDRPRPTTEGIVAAFSSYLGVSGGKANDGLMAFRPGGPGCRLTEAADGLSNTLLLGERPPPNNGQAGQWYAVTWPFGENMDSIGPSHVMDAWQFGYGHDVTCPTPGYGPGRLDNPCDRYHFWSLHRGGAHFVFGDGSGRYLAYSVGRDTLVALGTRSGGETVELP